MRLTSAFAQARPLGSEWEAPVYERFKGALRPGMTVLDVGASFGLYSIAAARGVGPTGHVFAFEPADRTASALELHLGWNGVADRVHVVRAAAAEKSGWETFWEQGTSFLASLVEDVPRREEDLLRAPLEARVVQAVSLDDFCGARGIDPHVVKVDVEGGEAAVLRGARQMLERRKAALFLEVHTGLLGDAAATLDDVFDPLADAGWRWEEVHSEDAGTRHYVCAP